MSKTFTLEQITRHMESQSSEYLQEFLNLLDGLDANLKSNGFEEPTKEDGVRATAIRILKERGVTVC